MTSILRHEAFYGYEYYLHPLQEKDVIPTFRRTWERHAIERGNIDARERVGGLRRDEDPSQLFKVVNMISIDITKAFSFWDDVN